VTRFVATDIRGERVDLEGDEVGGKGICEVSNESKAGGDCDDTYLQGSLREGVLRVFIAFEAILTRSRAVFLY